MRFEFKYWMFIFHFLIYVVVYLFVVECKNNWNVVMNSNKNKIRTSETLRMKINHQRNLDNLFLASLK